MPAKEQEAQFRRALALHQEASDENSLRAALSAYEQATAAASQTFPLAFNTASVCLALSRCVPSKADAQAFREAAANHLQQALSILPDNLEALIARAAVEDAFARAIPDALATERHRAAACEFLERGAVAEPSDPYVRVLLAEALVQYVEAAAESGTTEPTSWRHRLQSADTWLKQAAWLLDAKIAEISRMGTDPSALETLHKQRTQAAVTRAKLVLATVTLTEVPKAEATSELRRAEDALRGDSAGGSDADVVLLRAELLEAVAERDAGAAGGVLDEAIGLCRASIAAFDAEGAAEMDERRLEGFALLGDLCLARVRLETDQGRAGGLVGEGTRAYEVVVRAAESGGSGVESETLYNFACLVVVGTAAGCTFAYSERQVAELLKRSVDGGGVTVDDLTTDTDLALVRDKQWFANLVEYSKRTRNR